MTADPLADALRSLGLGDDLSADRIEAAVGQALRGEASEAALAGLLTALRLKGETADELAGAVAAVRSHMVTGGLAPAPLGAIDTCGTGGDGANTVNVSTATAVVVAACGVPVVKHGNRSASGNSGSAEVLTELGVDINASDEILNACVASCGIVFLFAPRFHPGLRHAAPVRKALPFRTLFNLVGPLANPASPTYQLLGVAGERQADLVAKALARIGPKRAAVVTGSDGLDEVTLTGSTRARIVEEGEVRVEEWSTGDFGLGEASLDALRVTGPADSARMILAMLGGERGAVRDTVLANAAAALRVAGVCGGLREGVDKAARAIDEGTASRLLARWITVSRGGGEV